jgi:Flp pilus assembly pilin Flp
MGNSLWRARMEGKAMLTLIERLIAEPEGQDLAEYGIALAVISILAGLAAVVISKDVGTLWSQAQSVIQSATTAVQS